jgi:hypothetical protein
MRAETRARKDAGERDRRGVEIEIKALEVLRDNQARRLKRAETLADSDALDSRCAEFAAEVGREYAPLAKSIVALMVASRRLQALAKRKAANGPPLREIVTSDEFCASLRLPCIEADGVKGFLWYPGRPCDIDKIEAIDAVSLDEVEVEDPAQAGHAAKEAMQKIASAYKSAASGIVELIKRDNEFVKQVEQMNGRIGAPLSLHVRTPAEKLSGGRVRALERVIRLPSAGGHGKLIW